jgi:hypothetical protein
MTVQLACDWCGDEIDEGAAEDTDGGDTLCPDCVDEWYEDSFEQGDEHAESE